MSESPPRALRTLIADDHTLVRESLVSVLQGSGLCEVVAQAADGPSALASAETQQPELAIVDIAMPGLNGLEVVRRLRASLPQLRILVLTMHEEQEYLLHAVRAGADAFLLKDSPSSDLLEAVRQLARGRGYFGPKSAKILASQLQQPARDIDDPYRNLTTREREVFHLMIEGLSTKEIARRLDTSAKTAENHRAKVLAKLEARNTADVIRYAVKRGLLT